MRSRSRWQLFVIWTLTLLSSISSASNEQPFDNDWRFYRGDDPHFNCLPFTIDAGQAQCSGLKLQKKIDATNQFTIQNADLCQALCCAMDDCDTWSFCPKNSDCVNGTTIPPNSCWMGEKKECWATTDGWITRSRQPHSPNPKCDLPFCQAEFTPDADWHHVDLPHDWSNEDLPPRHADTANPVISIRNGTWLFQKGDNSAWSGPDFDDSSWMSVMVPHDWRDPPSSYSSKGTYGWYRRHFKGATATQLAAADRGELLLALGHVASVDVTFLNGIEIGGVGGDPSLVTPCEEYLAFRRYLIPPGVLNRDGDNVVAVRVYSNGNGSKPGGLFDSGAPDGRVGPFDAGGSLGLKEMGYTVGGTGWYRKTFQSPLKEKGSGQVLVRFDGVYMNSDMWLNGHHLGNRPYGYTTFTYDLTPFLMPGENVMAVRVRSKGLNTRWYSGSGIYRHVTLLVMPLVHIPLWGMSVIPTQKHIDVAGLTSKVSVLTTIQNDKSEDVSLGLEVRILDPRATVTGILHQRKKVHIQARNKLEVWLHFDITNVSFWSPDTPALYHAHATLSGPHSSDEATTRFGIRSITFSPNQGLLLNGNPIKLQGGCVHHDHGPLGSKSIDRAEERKVELLKANGYNAIRTSHNPASPALVEACDRLGMFLMEEAFDCWEVGKNPHDYNVYFDDWWQRDIESMVIRDRNSPSIIMWSIGNEIEERATQRGQVLSQKLADYVRKLDPMEGWGRAVTSAIPVPSHGDDPYMVPLDVAGYNYAPDRYAGDHTRVPSRVMVGTESFPARTFQAWMAVIDNPSVIGDFIWTAIDYHGEASIGSNGAYAPDIKACDTYCAEPWPYFISFCGDFDFVGNKKPQSYYRNVLWGVSLLEMAVHAPHNVSEIIGGWGWPDERQSWTWNDPTVPLTVNVYTQLPIVRLILNGKDIGAQTVSRATQFTATFSVHYEPGTLEAIGYEALPTPLEPPRRILRTAQAPVALRATSDRPSLVGGDRDDLAYITIEAIDGMGVVNPLVPVVVGLAVEGDAEIVAVGNGDPSQSYSFHAPTIRLYRGQCVAILRPTKARMERENVTLLAHTMDGKLSTTLTLPLTRRPSGNLTLT